MNLQLRAKKQGSSCYKLQKVLQYHTIELSTTKLSQKTENIFFENNQTSKSYKEKRRLSLHFQPSNLKYVMQIGKCTKNFRQYSLQNACVQTASALKVHQHLAVARCKIFPILSSFWKIQVGKHTHTQFYTSYISLQEV